jgi:hypothetical protein
VETATIKVFRLNDCDWFAGENLESCIKCFFSEYLTEEDTPENREEYLCDTEELDDSQLDVLKFHDLEGDWGPANTQYTFREALTHMQAAGDKFPCFFASTEY